MHLSNLSTQTDSRSPPAFGTTTRAVVGVLNDTAQPSLTSGFGRVIEKEHELQWSIEGHLRESAGAQPVALDRVLRNQQVRVGANIALLEQRYEMLPHPARFQILQRANRPSGSAAAPAVPGNLEVLRLLLAQHLSLLGNVETLMARAPDGQRGELILREVARNHQDMAGMLAALLKEDETARDAEPSRVIAENAAPRVGEQRWENEGGAPRDSQPPRP